MSLIEDNTIFSGKLVWATMNPFLSTLKFVLSLFSSNNIISPSFVCILRVLFITERKKNSAFTLGWMRFLPDSAEPLQHYNHTKNNKHLYPPFSVADCQCHTAIRLCALHFVPAPSYGKVHWDYVQNALRSAEAYTSHHKSDSHWEACNTTPAELDKPSILPFIPPLLFCFVIYQWKNEKKK